MASWPYIDPNAYGDNDLYKNIQHSTVVANAIGGMAADAITEAQGVSRALTDAIAAIREQAENDVDALNFEFQPNLDTATQLERPPLPPLPTLPQLPTFGPAPAAPLAEASALTEAVTALGAAPEIDAAGAPGAPPDGPETDGTLLSDAAYSGAWALLRDAALQAETAELWSAGIGVKANGIGLPFPAQQALEQQARQRRAQTIQQAAAEQAQRKASDLREDRRFAYTQALEVYRQKAAAWQATEQAKVAAFGVAVQKFEAQLRAWIEEHGTKLRVSEQALKYWQTVEQQTAQRVKYEIDLLQASLGNEWAKIDRQLQVENARLAWRSASNVEAMQKEKTLLEASQRFQELAVEVSRSATLAVAAGLGEQFKAWFAAVSLSLSASTNVAGTTLAVNG